MYLVTFAFLRLGGFKNNQRIDRRHAQISFQQSLGKDILLQC